jgi:hypothetical protein
LLRHIDEKPGSRYTPPCGGSFAFAAIFLILVIAPQPEVHATVLPFPLSGQRRGFGL